MIGFSFVYIFFAFIIIVGVIFVIYGLSQHPHGSTNPAAADNNLDSDEPAQDVIDLVRVVEEGNVSKHEPEIPKTFDINSIQQQLARVQHSPNVITSYFAALEGKFRTNQEMKLLKKLKEYHLLIADGFASKRKIFEEQTGLQQAIQEFNREQKGTYKQLKDIDAELKIRTSIAESRRKIAESEAKIEEYRIPPQQEKSTRRTPKERREQDLEWLDVQAEDMAALDEWRREKLAKLEARMAEELEDLEDLPLSEEDKQRRIYETKTRYAKQKKEILKAKFR